jgi:O-succinylbenzoate synthase
MARRFYFHPYRRTFIQPLRTARGEWLERDGFIVRVEDAQRVGYGEIAPIPEFGSETMTQAEDFLWRLEADPLLADDTSVLAALPCCAFGLSSALIDAEPSVRRDYDVAALLPAGETACFALKAKLALGYQTFKWKIGVAPAEVEQSIFKKLVEQLPKGARLRLDANGGLSVSEFEAWLWVLQRHAASVEYLEQPLAVGQERVMASYAQSFSVPIALDESLNGEDGAEWLSRWTGPLVVKPALMGDCCKLVESLRPLADRVVLSSVFETTIGLDNVLQIADQLPEHNLAIGFDTLDAFADSLSVLKSSAAICAVDRSHFSLQEIWKQLPYLT